MNFDLWVIYLLAGTIAAVEALSELSIASLAHPVGPWPRRVAKRFTQARVGVFVAICRARRLRS